MFYQLFCILAPLIVSTSIGFIWAKAGEPFPTDFTSRLVMMVGTPSLILSVVNKMHVDVGVVGDVAMAMCWVMLITGLLGWLLLRWFGLSVADYLPPLIFPNNGNLGLPLCLFAFGQTGLALAMGSFMVMLFATFTLGLVLMGEAHLTFVQRLKSVFKQPVVYATLIATWMMSTHHTLPLWIANTVDLLGGIAMALMIITLGFSLAGLKIASLKLSVALSVSRVFGGLLIGWLVTVAMGLTGVARSVVIIQAAMPAAVFSYMLALRYNRSPEDIAATVLVSTVLAFIGLPFLLAWLL